MTRHYLTPKDIEALKSGDPDKVAQQLNAVRGELTELQETVKNAIKTADPAERACTLKKAINRPYLNEPSD